MPIINQVVSGGGSAPAHYIEKTVDANGKLVNGNTIIDFTGVTDIGDYALAYAYRTNTNISGTVDMSDIITISGSAACNSAFQNTNITGIDMSALTTISGQNACNDMFTGCTRLTSANLSSLTTISGSTACQAMFSGCRGITSADLSSLTTVSAVNACQAMFSDCTGLTSVDLSSLTTIANGGLFSAFFNCSSLTKIYLPKITSSSYVSRPNYRDFFAFEGSGLEVCDMRNIQTVGNYGVFDNMLAQTRYLKKVNVNSLEHIGNESARAFLISNNNPSSTLTDVYFPMLTSFGSNPFYTNCFGGRLGLTIHFRKDIQATVEALANYSTMWGAGTGSSVVFDLAGTLTGADSNAYTRSEIDSVYASETAGAAKTATAWKYNNVVYYTSGGSEPSIGDTIYSDSACTQSVTTITAIA